MANKIIEFFFGKENKRNKCNICKEETNEFYHGFNGDYCKKCYQIHEQNMPNCLSEFYEPWAYIKYYAIKDKELKWYIEARNKLCKKLDEEDKRYKERRRKEKEELRIKVEKTLKNW